MLEPYLTTPSDTSNNANSMSMKKRDIRLKQMANSSTENKNLSYAVLKLLGRLGKLFISFCVFIFYLLIYRWWQSEHYNPSQCSYFIISILEQLYRRYLICNIS